MQDFNHPHIMPLIGVCYDTGVGVVMPFMANGSVLQYLKKEREQLQLSEEADIEQVSSHPYSVIIYRRTGVHGLINLINDCVLRVLPTL